MPWRLILFSGLRNGFMPRQFNDNQFNDNDRYNLIGMNQQVQEILQRYWQGGLDQRLPVFASLLAIVLLSYSLATLSWRLLPMPEMDPVVRLTSNQQRQVQAGERKDALVAQKIRQWNLFGEVEKEAPKPQVVAQEVIPVSKSNLKLRGVFASKIAANARAIIADKNIDESYKIGSQLPGGAILTEIYDDRVIIESNGRLETLLLPDADSDGSGNVASSRASDRSTRTTARQAVLSSGQDVMNASNNISDNSALLRTYKEALLTNPNSMMGLVNIRPYQKDGRLVGYRIRPGRDRGLLKRFGLRSGDIVTSVNGIGLDNPVKALEVLRDLSSATNLTLGVERNGAPQSFSFAIE